MFTRESNTILISSNPHTAELQREKHRVSNTTKYSTPDLFRISTVQSKHVTKHLHHGLEYDKFQYYSLAEQCSISLSVDYYCTSYPKTQEDSDPYKSQLDALPFQRNLQNVEGPKQSKGLFLFGGISTLMTVELARVKTDWVLKSIITRLQQNSTSSQVTCIHSH